MVVSPERYRGAMRRLFDVVLIALVLAVVGFGAYELGHRVDHTSTSLSSQDPELQTPTVATTKPKSDTRRIEIIVGGAVAATVGLIVLGSLASSLVRARRRQYWRAS